MNSAPETIIVSVDHYRALLDDRDELQSLARIALNRGWRGGSVADFISQNWTQVR